MTQEKLLTPGEVMERFSISKITLQRWRDDGMPYHKLSTRTFRYDMVEIENWLEVRKLSK